MQANLSVKISDMDYDRALELLKNEIHTSNPLEKMAIGFMGSLPPKLLIGKIIGSELAKNKIMDKVNRRFEEKYLDISVYNFFVKADEQASIDLYCTIGDILPFIERKINLENKNLNSIVACSVNSVFKEIPDSMKANLLNRIFREAEQDICNYISDLVSENYFDLKIDSIIFYASDI